MKKEKNNLHTDENRYPVSFLDYVSQHGMEKTCIYHYRVTTIGIVDSNLCWNDIYYFFDLDSLLSELLLVSLLFSVFSSSLLKSRNFFASVISRFCTRSFIESS